MTKALLLHKWTWVQISMYIKKKCNKTWHSKAKSQALLVLKYKAKFYEDRYEAYEDQKVQTDGVKNLGFFPENIFLATIMLLYLIYF